MRKSTLRSLLILGGAFALLAAFAPRADAALLRYYNFEGPPTGGYLVNLESHTPAIETGAFTGLTLKGTDPPGAPYPVADTFVGPEIPFNLAGPPGTTSFGANRTAFTNLNVNIPFLSSTGIYDITNVSFAYGSNGNGYAAVQLKMSTDGGATFTNLSGVIPLAATPGAQIIIPAIPSGTTLGIPNLVLRLSFTGGQSNGTDEQFELDNIQIGGTAVPEPATVAGGLLGVLGLCWHQRRRLIRSVRFRRT